MALVCCWYDIGTTMERGKKDLDERDFKALYIKCLI